MTPKMEHTDMPPFLKVTKNFVDSTIMIHSYLLDAILLFNA